MVAKGTSLLLLLLLVVVSAVSGQSFSRMNRLSTTKHRWLLKFNNSTSMNNNATGELCIGNSTYCPDRMTFDDEEVVVDEDDVLERDGGSETRRNWYESVPMPPVVVATSRTLPEGACKRQLTRYIEALGNGTLWATQMFDASAKYPQGVFDGNTWQLGSFDQCYRIDTSVAAAGENNGVGDVRGRYCLVDFKYEQRDAAPDFQGRLNIDFDPNQSAWEAIREKGDFRRVRRYLLQMALCVPAACSAEDVQMALQGPYADYGMKNNLIIKVDVDKNNCQTYLEEPEFSTGAIVFSSILFGLFTLVVISSWYDGTLTKEEEPRSKSAMRQVLLCFSAKRNWHSIFEVSYKHRGLDTIHMIKFFAMCLVMVGHRAMEYYLNDTINARHLEMAFNVPSFIMVLNGPIIVDGFFGIGGLLTCYGLLHLFSTSKHMNFVSLVLIRFLRLTPAYALLVFFHVYLFPHLGSGPQWQSKVVAEADNCAATWWANLFYFNNYFTMDKICIFQSWYLSVDFHCYLIAIVLIYVFSKTSRKIGWSILGSATFISIAIPFIMTYFYRIQPVFIGFPYLNGLHMDPYFINYYVKTHLRISAYLVGVICGAILYDYQHATWRISKAWAQGMFILVALTCIYSQSLGYQYYNPNSNPSSLEMALYASLHRAAFSGAFCCVILLITMGDGLDFHYNFLTPRWVQPLGRLTYSVFLTHNIIQIYDVGTVRSPRVFSIKNAFWNFVPDLFYSFSLALLVALGVEGPFRRLEKFLLTKRVPPMSKHEKETDSCDAKSEETKKID